MNRTAMVFALAVSTLVVPARAQKMTYEEARAKLTPRELPAFWIGSVDDLPGRWEKLTQGEVRRIAESPGGRPLHVIAYGEREKVNDRGINPMHDEFFAPMGPEAPAILRVALEEGPDLAVSLHSHGSKPAVLRPAYVPMEIQEQTRTLAEQFGALMEKRGLPHGRPPQARPESGEPPAPFNLTSALYHVSGAIAFTFECPHGIAGERMCQVTFDEILGIQHALYEAMMRFALRRKRP